MNGSATTRTVQGVGYPKDYWSASAVLILASLAFGVGMTAWTFSRSSVLLDRWASDNGYQIVHSELRWLRRGPSFWISSRGQMIYHVVVRT